MGAERFLTETTLFPGPWYRRSPYFEATVRAGCKAYDVYNHTLLPGYYDDPNVEYELLLSGVVVWDVGAEWTIEVSGPDADRLPRPHAMRGETGQVHVGHRPRRRHRERPGAAARR